MRNKWLWYIGFFVILFGVYFIYIFNDFDFSQSGLPIINNNVQPFSFINQNGKKVSQHEIEGKVYAADYFFTTCRGICPRMNANMRRVFDMYKNENDFMIISHTCMPEADSVPALKKYEGKMINGTLEKSPDGKYNIEYDSAQSLLPVNNPNWNFVTGDKSALYKMARHSYLIDNNKSDTANKIEEQFIHTQLFALMDKQGSLRGIYDGLKEEEVQKLLTDIRKLLNEKHTTRSLKGF